MPRQSLQLVAPISLAGSPTARVARLVRAGVASGRYRRRMIAINVSVCRVSRCNESHLLAPLAALLLASLARLMRAGVASGRYRRRMIGIVDTAPASRANDRAALIAASPPRKGAASERPRDDDATCADLPFCPPSLATACSLILQYVTIYIIIQMENHV
ncbi:hypothetical protein O0L34_g1032 [Tuta absoluta]|nr:hypothetical protein O0L34_g1032 [Tuta absoluta]